MATIRFYLDRIFKDPLNEQEKEIAKKSKRENKPYPVKILYDRETSIYVYFTLRKGSVFKVKTEFKIMPRFWDFNRGEAKSSFTEALEFNRGLDKLKGKLAAKYRELFETKATLKEIKAEFENIIKGPVNEKENETSYFYKTYDEFVKINSRRLSKLSIRKYNTLLTVLKEYDSKNKLAFDNIDLKFFDRFVYWLQNKPNPQTGENGLLNDTISKYVETLKVFMKWSYERSFHTNQDYKKFTATRKAKNEIVTLNDQELQQFYNFDFSNNKKLERVRDLFCFGVFTGQRWGDIQEFDKDNIEDNVWIFEAAKTKKLTRVPLVGFSGPALDILKKYNYKLPAISGQKFNEYIKEAAQKAGLHRIVKIKRYRGNETIIREKPVHKFIASHMARRTCITVLLERGVPPTTIMKLTGHSDLKTLMKYENTSDEALTRELERVGSIDKPALKVV